jgi:TonB family protein
MSRAALQDVFSLDELARAARVPPSAVRRLVDSGELRLIPGTRYVWGPDAVRAGQHIQTIAPPAPASLGPPSLFAPPLGRSSTESRRGFPVLASSGVHLLLLGLVLWMRAGPTQTAPAPVPREESRLVYLIAPGPGGGGGGGGTSAPRPAPRTERKGVDRPRLAVPRVKPDPVLTTARRVEEPLRPTPVTPPPPEPKPIQRTPDPLPSQVLVAPVVAAAPNTRDLEGVIERPVAGEESQGAGSGGGAGSGRGTGNGEGLGSGIGEGSGGGTGGGPYRPGSGIDAPRLLREVKAEYSEAARRRNVTGDVVLEIVVTRDGGVGDIRILHGLGSGLDERAVAAVRQWRFSPARRRGEVVDVIVEVAVEFTLR